MLHANSDVAARRLVGLVWDEPPRTADAALRNHLCALRKSLRADGEPRVSGGQSGYRITVYPAELDFAEFRRHAEAARHAERRGDARSAITEYARSLEIWKGRPFAGETLTRQMQALAQYVTALHDQAEVRYWRARLEQGQHGDLVGELKALLMTQPLREDVAELLMVALYRCGRQNEALATFHETRRHLVEALGVEPGVDLKRLHHAILAGDQRLSRPDTVTIAAPVGRVPAQLPMATPGFVGRREALAHLNAVTGSVTVISGTAGIGKTALALHWAHRHRADHPDGQLYVDLRGFAPGQSTVDTGDALRRFLEALGAEPSRIPDDRDARAAMYRSALAGKRVLVLLDNAANVGQVRPLLPGEPGCRVLVTSRDRLTGLVAEAGAGVVNLDVLTTAEATDLLVNRIGTARIAASPQAVARMLQRCAGLPLALAVVAARVAAQPDVPLDVLAEDLDAQASVLDGFGTDLRSTFSWSYTRLSEPAAALFRRLSLYRGFSISTAAAASLTGIAPPLARTLLLELVQAQLAIRHRSGSFVLHDLLLAYARELVRDEEADDAFRRMLDYLLHTAHRAARLLDPLRRQMDIAAAGPGVTPESFAAHDAALAWFDAERATLVATVAHASDAGFDHHAWQLAWALSTYLRRKGFGQDLLDTQRTALSSAIRSRDIAGQAHAHYLLALAHHRHGNLADATSSRRSALRYFQRLDDHYGQAGVHYLACWQHEQAGDFGTALSYATRVLRLYRIAGHRPGQARALGAIGYYRARLGEHRRALTDCRQSLSIAAEVGDLNGTANAWDSLGYIYRQLGRYDHAIGCYERAISIFSRLGYRFNLVQPLAGLGDTHQARADRVSAAVAWQQALDILTELDLPDTGGLLAKLGTVTDAVTPLITSPA